MFFKLLRVFFKENFGVRRLFGSKVANSKGRIILFVLLFVYSFLSIGFSSGMMFYTMGLKRELLLYIASYSTGMGFLFALMQANGFLFQFKDYEIIGPLPIKPLTLLLAKLTSMMVFIYIVTFVLTLPLFIVYYIFVPFNLLSFILLLIGYLIFPLPAIILGSFLSLLIARISKNFKRSNLIQTILMFALFLAIFVISMVGGINAEQGSFIPVWVIDAISSAYLPNEWFAAAAHDSNLLSFLYLLLTHLGFFFVFLFVISKLSVRTNQNRTTNKEIIIKSKKLQRTPIFSALLKKEWRRFVGTPIYIFNVAFGLIMLVIMAVAVLILKDNIPSEIAPFAPFIMLAAYAFCLVTVYTPAVNLSLEGRNFALLKTLPIKGETIMGAKIMFNLVLEIPIIVITLPLAAIGLGLDLWVTLASLLAIVSFAIFSSIFFAWINIFFPRFDYKSDAEVIKQGMAAFVAIFSGFGFLILEGVLLFSLSLLPLPSLAFPILFISIINCLIALIIYMPMHKKASLKLQRMEV
ncbi:MAG: hypothetical protein PHV19_01920 [Bacilli bacterium]|nr:hypothetical protein [Bacilli bacterium]